LPGAAEAVADLRASGRRVLFVTNNSAARVREHEAALAAVKIPAVDDVVSSSQAAGLLVEPGMTVMVGGGPGIIESVEARGAVAVTTAYTGGVDAVVVGLDRGFNYAKLTALSG